MSAAGTASAMNAGQDDASGNAGSQSSATMPAAGVSGTSGAGGASAPANPAKPGQGIATPRVPLDPKAVFEWPETRPGSGETCQPGTYTGTFSCTVNGGTFLGLPAPPDGAGLLVIGPVTLELERSMDGEFLEIEEGRLEGLALASWGFVAELEGRLDCSTLKFEAKASSGVYGLGLPIGVEVGNFGGTLSGALDDRSLELSGRWALVDALGTMGCDGPWTATLMP